MSNESSITAGTMDNAAVEQFTPEQTAHAEKALQRPSLVLQDRSFGWISDKICSLVEGPTPLWWWIAFLMTSSLAMASVFGFTYLISTGVGVWGNNSPVGWAWDWQLPSGPSSCMEVLSGH